MKKILLTILAIAAMAACKKDDTICYNNFTMGNIDGETIISDQGNTFDIAESYYGKIDFSWFEYGRVILNCDVLRKTAEQRYDIRLTSIASVLTKSAVKASTITDSASEVNVEDPLIIREIWYSGGYLNILIEFAVKHGSQTKHLINLIHQDVITADEASAVENIYAFTLRHNAFGEVPNEDDLYSTSLGYVSFPIASLITEDKATLIIQWESHKFENGRYNFYESESASEQFKWERSGFEHKTGIVKSFTNPNQKLDKMILAR